MQLATHAQVLRNPETFIFPVSLDIKNQVLRDVREHAKQGVFMKHTILATLLLIGSYASAEIIVEEPGSKAIFQVNDRTVSPVEAQAAAAGHNKVVRCSPIKDAMTSDGKPAYRCKQVSLVINPKTGTTKWKNL